MEENVKMVTVMVPVKRNNVFTGYREKDIPKDLADRELKKPEHKRGQNWQGVKLKGDEAPYVDPDKAFKEALKSERTEIISSLTDKPNIYALADMSDEEFNELVELLKSKQEESKEKKETKKQEGNK
jgi:DNA primase